MHLFYPTENRYFTLTKDLEFFLLDDLFLFQFR